MWILPLPVMLTLFSQQLSAKQRKCLDDPVNVERPRWGPFVTIAKQYKWVWLNAVMGLRQSKPRPSRTEFWDEFAFKEGFRN